MLGKNLRSFDYAANDVFCKSLSTKYRDLWAVGISVEVPRGSRGPSTALRPVLPLRSVRG
jgi:hypothetical protein